MVKFRIEHRSAYRYYRAVSLGLHRLGYLYSADQNVQGAQGSGSTHAWTEVYVPGAGWITFDPTNPSIGSFNLIPVAVARNIKQATPVAGSFVGMTDAFKGLSVELRVTRSLQLDR